MVERLLSIKEFRARTPELRQEDILQFRVSSAMWSQRERLPEDLVNFHRATLLEMGGFVEEKPWEEEGVRRLLKENWDQQQEF